ncbi:type VII secretion-associated serine protease mycosin [Saccharopolyspora sp. ASAGF58]|uniref:type VII secretion-associated serine protease mycosin n=1 Tax=Saccharopolyspora sp. ASAGF58 TaxID=2719023 RepID=UPI00143FB8D1|nr:type VII secretion-associated serine protease mycosin [Saccharopolyspora sp. ASAGF58]QIZ34791.1 type VII secretion-associated serine protease mycosin [Saccharopolyspora sp. ASAGF58]
MRSRISRSRGGLRGFALLAAVGTFALGGPTAPAVAQTVGPPQLNEAWQTGSKMDASPGYEQKQGCMRGNTGNSMIEEKPWSQLVLGYERAHEQGLKGEGQKVAVIDTGVNPHPRLHHLQGGDNTVPGGGATFDCDGHGTIVAGIIGAAPDETGQTGYVGIAPEATILSIRQSSQVWIRQSDNSTIGNTKTMAQAINGAVDQGAAIINISQSSCQPIAQGSNPLDVGNQELHNAVKQAYEAGVVVVAAAGNVGEACQKNPAGSPTTAVLPAWFDDYVLTVASVNQAGAPSEFTVPGPWVDVAAPGENLITLDPGAQGKGLASQIAGGKDGQMGPIQGTSFAAPYVSGLAALIKEKFAREGKPMNTAESAKQVMDRIKQTALHPGGINGRNDIVGYGMVDPMAALSDVLPSEYDKAAPPPKPTKLDVDVIPQKDFPALIIALGGAGAGIAAIIFTAFLVNAVRNVRARARENSGG